jgi:4'-phosphopantetheinyl transferase
MELVPPDWEPRAPVPDLPAGVAHLWRVRADTGDAAWREILDPRENERLSRFRFAEDALREAAGRGALRLLLGAYLGVPPLQVALLAEPTGKPKVAGQSGDHRIEFNLSHSGNWVLLAFARGSRVGIDVEQWKGIEFEEIASEVFTPEEVKEWMLWPVTHRPAAFFGAWTLKESYLKALGTGISKPPRSVRVSIAPATAPVLIWCADDPAAAARWRLARLGMEPGYSAALTVERGINRGFSFTLQA